jgi:ribonucleoside-diphosphate reductase alpha chain
LIDMAAERGAFIDQSQSLNLFLESPTIGKLSSMYFYAWKRGLKTTYYLRSRPATRIAKTTVTSERSSEPQADPHAERGWTPAPPQVAEGGQTLLDASEQSESSEEHSAAVACSLENPETCEACQ